MPLHKHNQDKFLHILLGKQTTVSWWLLRQDPSLPSARRKKALIPHPHNTEYEQSIPVLMLSQISLLHTVSLCHTHTHTSDVRNQVWEKKGIYVCSV